MEKLEYKIKNGPNKQQSKIENKKGQVNFKYIRSLSSEPRLLSINLIKHIFKSVVTI